MKLINKLANATHEKLFGIRCDRRPGIHYFDESCFPGLVKDDFEFKNQNGYLLRGGYYHEKEYDTTSLIILCHGMGGGHQAYMKEIAYFCHNGFKVLTFDYQGTILSEGDSLGGISQALQDMNQCVNLIKNKYQNIYVIGHSWGGWVAQGIAYLNPEITKLVTLAGMNSLQSLVNQYFPWPLSFLKTPLLNIEYEKYGDISKLSELKTLNKRQDLHALVIQSKDDGILKTKYNLELIESKLKNQNVEIIEVDGRYHNPNYTTEAVKKLTIYLHKLNKIKSDEEKEKIADETNWDELCELDTSIMDKIINFFIN